jgi:cell division protein FtsI (penicillin-binding protein 3)
MFDHLLAGRDGTETYEIGGGNRIPLGDNSTVPARSGHDLRLTIDRDVQWYAQRALGNAVQSSGSDSGAAVVMDTRTGELLALADYPTFNPSNTAGTSKKLLGSRALRAMYEPGSVEKILTTAALLNDHLVSPRTRIVVPPQLQVADRVIHDDVAHGRMKLTLTGVIARSSNIGVTLAADQISAKRLHDYLSRFGLGRRTGLGVRGETPGLLADPSTWGAAQKANIAFGQGVAVNAVQMAAAVNTIANGGVYVPPSLVKGRASLNDGTVVGSATGTSRRVVSAATARAETSMMETVTKDGGTAPGTAIAGYNVAGKTGTAQRVDQRCHCYSSARVVSFAGFAPADAPRFLVYVVADRPRNGGFGSTVAGPVFRELMTYLLQKYAVPPTGHVAKTPPLTW